MFTRCMELLAALTLLAFFAGAPAVAHDAGNHHNAVTAESSFAVDGVRALEASKLRLVIERNSETGDLAHQTACPGCCACSGGGCQSMATLPFGAEYAPPPLILPVAVPEAAGPPRRLQRSLEHPPKSFA